MIGKKEQVRAMFDNIAPTYDRLNHVLSFNFDRTWRRKAIAMVAKNKPEDIIDIATGTADLAISMAQRIPGSNILGVDISEEMLAVGREKITAAGLTDRINLETGDAEALRFADGSFDAATIAFGIRNFQDIDAGLREATRVLRTGGHACILEFSTPRGRFFGPLYRFYFHKILPVIGSLVSKDNGAYKYLPASVDVFPENLLFLHNMECAGFTACTSRRLMGGIAYIYLGEKK